MYRLYYIALLYGAGGKFCHDLFYEILIFFTIFLLPADLSGMF
jgi:hypothetical protein